MREYKLTVNEIKNPLYDCPIKMSGKNDKNQELKVGNYFLMIDNKPFYAISGEAHFSRMNEKLWEDEILKMKTGGINIISMYIFWIHHEEIEGKFDWSGNKNLRKFTQLCKKNNIFLMIRIGPFSHGECRNGGLPDWLYGRPFDIRCNDPHYLTYTKRFYTEIFNQVQGLLYKDGGPIMGVQLENELEHASCPWEMTTENSKEWVPSGRDGRNHMIRLREIAKEVGFTVPLFTTTAWGGACAPEDIVFPLWGGYAYRPWMFYDNTLKEHPATAEYLYGDFHNNNAPKYYNFDPEYPAEDFPYACCEMGGGMNVYYPYRFQLPYQSVGALAQVKVGSGCNFVGYYMYHGGTHPQGKKVEFLNECAVPKFSYDYQAAIGEFGQIRPSYHYLMLQHLFYKEFQTEFSTTKTFLSEEAKVQKPEDINTLRYVIRVNEQKRGFLFINNFQDHVECKKQENFAIELKIKDEVVRIPAYGSLNMEKEAYAILPFNLSMGKVNLKYATTQLITRIHTCGIWYYFFYQIPAMRAEFYFDLTNEISINEFSECQMQEGKIIINEGRNASFTVKKGSERFVVCTLCANDAFRLHQIQYNHNDYLIFSDMPVFVKNGKIEFEYELGKEHDFMTFPKLPGSVYANGTQLFEKKESFLFYRYHGLFEKNTSPVKYEICSSKNDERDTVLKRPVVGSPLTTTKVVNARVRLAFSEEDFVGLKQYLLKIDYLGDVGYAFIDGQMIHDNFYNGTPWEIDLYPYKNQLIHKGMYIYISPKKYGAYVDNTSAMAARIEHVQEQKAEIHKIHVVKIKRVILKCSKT